MTSLLTSGSVPSAGRNITLEDYDSLPNPAYRDKIEEVYFGPWTRSSTVQALLAPHGPLWPMDIFLSALSVLEREPDLSANSLYFSAISSVLCRALTVIRAKSQAPSPAPLPVELSSEERRAVRKRIVSTVHHCPSNPLRVQVLRNMHIKWTSAMMRRSGYSSDDSENTSDEDEGDIILVRRAESPTRATRHIPLDLLILSGLFDPWHSAAVLYFHLLSSHKWIVSLRISLTVPLIGSGAAGLITAQTLVADGFTNVQVFRANRVQAGCGLEIVSTLDCRSTDNVHSVHGEYEFSALEMPANPINRQRITGVQMQRYMETFAKTFLARNIRYDVRVMNLRREQGIWYVTLEDLNSRSKRCSSSPAWSSVLGYARPMLSVACSSSLKGCFIPRIPENLTPASAQKAGFVGPVVHSRFHASHLADIMAAVPSKTCTAEPKTLVVVGGGKSAQDIAAYYANEGRRVTIVYKELSPFLATPLHLPGFLRKSRFLAVFSLSQYPQTRLEHFLHHTWIGDKVAASLWSMLRWFSFLTVSALAPRSPLQCTEHLRWSAHLSEEGVPLRNGFHAHVTAGTIQAIPRTVVRSFGTDGHSLVLDDGRIIAADAVMLATGHASSWAGVFDENTALEVGIHRSEETRMSPLYHGIVPAKNIYQRDLAVNGAVYGFNPGYTWEAVAHWISSYFLGDALNIPQTQAHVDQATTRDALWLRRRFPHAAKICESNSGYITAYSYVVAVLRRAFQRHGAQDATIGGKLVDVAVPPHTDERSEEPQRRAKAATYIQLEYSRRKSRAESDAERRYMRPTDAITLMQYKFSQTARRLLPPACNRNVKILSF
ncbi:unnamed protein product [Mycena citricolor]|uniref:L-ornithine N(5)-oxygenase n=1 Tax=Mycena citricolor TaxID=2018698 RepID=A0AAD2HZE4_9AGAR|nr:unnamed protein product [Mycena citricolor]